MKVFPVKLIANNRQRGCLYAIGAVVIIIVCLTFVSPFLLRHTRPSKKEYLNRYLPEPSVSSENVSFVFVGGVGGDATFSRIIIGSGNSLTWTNKWILKRTVKAKQSLSELQLRSSEFGISGNNEIVVTSDFKNVKEVRIFEDERNERGVSCSRQLHVPVPFGKAVYLMTFDL